MNVPAVMQRHRSLRWLVPVCVLTVVGLAASGMFTAAASESKSLPPTTPAALLAAVRTPPVTGFSGTIVSQVSLGLPELPALGSDRTTMMSLLSGSHTVQVWYGGPTRQRIALLGATDETDVFRAGRQLWTWSSSERIARHGVLPASTAGDRPGSLPTVPPSAAGLRSMTPSGLADAALAALSPTTRVTVQAGRQVADRAAYELVLTPRTSATRIGSVRISVDGRTKLPLAVQVYARGARSPAIDVSFTSVRFAVPSATYFHFSPPAGARVRAISPDTGLAGMMSRHGVSVSGSGWSRVVELDTGKAIDVGKGQLGQALTPVSGSWGKGGLLQASLGSVLVTDKGRIFAGTVEPAALYAAAGAK